MKESMEYPQPSSSPERFSIAAENAQTSKPTPEQRLMVAIVRRAVWDFVLYRRTNPDTDSDRYNMAADAAGWLFWDGEERSDNNGLYTFRHICATLDLDAKEVRDGILKLERNDIQRLNNNIKDST